MVSLPLCAVAPVPSTTAVQRGREGLAWTRVRVRVVVPLAELKETALMCQGRAPAVTVNARLNGPVHLLKLIEVTEPMLVPDSRLPLLSVVFAAEDVHVSEVPVVVSFRVVVPDVALMTLPGLTVQEVAARAGPALRPRTAATAAARRRMLPGRFRMVIGTSPLIVFLGAPPRVQTADLAALSSYWRVRYVAANMARK